MKIRVDFGDPLISQEELKDLTATDLNDFYATASDPDKTNLFFVLLNSMHHYEAAGRMEETAYLCFLLAYYLFVPLTPPGSAPLAQYYLQKAILLDERPEYLRWRELMEK